MRSLWILLLWFVLARRGAHAQTATNQTTSITLTWDANSPDDAVNEYRVFQATNAAGPFVFVGATATTNATLQVIPGRYFWYVTAINFWNLESPPSQMVSTPSLAGKVANLRVTR